MLASAQPAMTGENSFAGSSRLLFLTHAGAPGGAEYKMLSLCQHLPQAEVLTFSQGSFMDILRRSGIPAQVCPMPEAMGQVRRENGLGAVLRAIPAVVGMMRDVARHCRRYDVLVPMSQKVFMMVALAKPLHRKPIVWYMNDLLSREHFSPMMIRVLTFLSRFTANHIIFNSQASLQGWVAAGGRSQGVSVSYPGSDVPALDKELSDKALVAAFKAEFSPDGQPLIGTIGRISPWKGQDVFLQALAQIPDVRGVIVGDALFGEAEYAARLHEMAQELGVAERVTFAGHRDNVVSIMAACDVVAHCSTSPEPFGRVIVEAMLAQSPVIASDAGGAKEIVVQGETGFLTPPGNAEALADAIRFYLNNPAQAEKMVAAARKRAEQHFSCDAMVERLRHIIARLG